MAGDRGDETAALDGRTGIDALTRFIIIVSWA